MTRVSSQAKHLVPLTPVAQIVRKLSLWRCYQRPALGCLALLLVPGGGIRAAAGTASARPNVLFIAIDDLRDWLDPKAAWDQPAITTSLYMNHTIRAEGWRDIRYQDGGEALYDERGDPNEWANLANKPEFATKKAELAKWLPKVNHADIGEAKGSGSGTGTTPEAGESRTRKKAGAKEKN